MPTVSPWLLRQQIRPLTAMLAGGAWSLVPPTVRGVLDPPRGVVEQVVGTGSDRLVDTYAAWSGAPPERYGGTVPPHSFARWAMPVIARLTSKAPHGLLGVLNQGVHVRVHQPIPRHVDLLVRGRLADVTEEPGRIRISSAVTASAADDPRVPLLSIDVHAVVPTGGRRGPAAPAVTEPTWVPVGAFATARHDGKRFFLLTGDPHPLHTVEAFGRRTRFDGCILHGFGTLARTWEVLRDGGLAVDDLDVRFVAPNPLPNPRVVVERADAADPDGRRRIRARAADGTVHLAGWLADAATATATDAGSSR